MKSASTILKSALVIFLATQTLLTLNAQTFGNLHMGGAGFVSGIVYSKSEPNLRYARTDVGGAYRWDESAKEWIPLNDNVSAAETGFMGVESMALDPNDADKLYLSVGTSYFSGGKSAILISTDRGNTFTVTDVTSLFKIHGNGMGRNTGEKLAVDPNLGAILYCGSRSNGLFKSNNLGASWSRVNSLNVTSNTSGNGISFVIFDPASGSSGSETQTLIVGASQTGENLYRSNDAGATFTAIAGAPSTLMPMRAALSTDGNLFITYANAAGPYDPSTGQVWKYNLLSGNWTNITPATFTTPFGGISVDPNNPQRLVLSTINVYRQQAGQWGDQIFISTNGGTSWVNKVASGFKMDPNGIEWAKNGASIHWAGCIEFDPFNTKRISVISGNGIFTTDNIDSTTNVWKFDVHGLEETVPADLISIPGGPLLSVVYDYDGCRFTDITQYGKQHSPTMGSTVGLAVAALNPAKVARAGSKLYVSVDTAKTWKQAVINGEQGYLAYSADGEVLIHTPSSGVISYRSVDNGTSWAPIQGLSLASARIVADPVNPSVFYCYNSGTGKMLVSRDKGLSFISSGSAGSSGSKHIRVVPGREGEVWVALYNGGLMRSLDYGASFTKVKNLTACSAVGFGKEAPGCTFPTVYVWGTYYGTEGIFMSTDEARSWTRINDDKHQWGGLANGQFVAGDYNNEGIAYASTAGRGIVYAKADYMLGVSKLNIEVDSVVQVTPAVLNGEELSWTWISSNPTIAEVDANGLVKGVSIGSAVITASPAEGKYISTEINVGRSVSSIQITPVVDSIDLLESVQLSVTVLPEDASNKTISWSSSNPAVASVSALGMVRGLKTGTTIITAISPDKIKTSFNLTVGIALESIVLNPEADTIAITEKKQLIAEFTPSNTTQKKLNWVSSAPAIVYVDGTGKITGKANGYADITATSSEVNLSATARIVVSGYPLQVEKSPENKISIYPNPLNTNILNINLGGLKGQTNIKLIDITGRLILENEVIDESLLKFDLKLKPGLYFLKISNGNKDQVLKLIVEK